MLLNPFKSLHITYAGFAVYTNNLHLTVPSPVVHWYSSGWKSTVSQNHSLLHQAQAVALDSMALDSTALDSIALDSTDLDSTALDSMALDSTALLAAVGYHRCRSHCRKSWTQKHSVNPFISVSCAKGFLRDRWQTHVIIIMYVLHALINTRLTGRKTPTYLLTHQHPEHSHDTY